MRSLFSTLHFTSHLSWFCHRLGLWSRAYACRPYPGHLLHDTVRNNGLTTPSFFYRQECVHFSHRATLGGPRRRFTGPWVRLSVRRPLSSFLPFLLFLLSLLSAHLCSSALHRVFNCYGASSSHRDGTLGTDLPRALQLAPRPF